MGGSRAERKRDPSGELSRISDEELMRRIYEEKKTAPERAEAWRRCKGVYRSLCAWCPPEVAWDAFTIAMEEVLEVRGRYGGGRRLEAFIQWRAERRARGLLRRRREIPSGQEGTEFEENKEGGIEQDPFTKGRPIWPAPPDPADRAVSRVELKRLLSDCRLCLARLPFNYVQGAADRIEGLSLKESMARHGWSYSKAKNNRSRGYLQLQECLHARGWGARPRDEESSDDLP